MTLRIDDEVGSDEIVNSDRRRNGNLSRPKRNGIEMEPVTEYHYSKARLPKGESYPLKRSDLDSLLAQVRAPRLFAIYLGRGVDPHLLGASFTPDCSRSYNAGTTTLRLHSVPSDLRSEVRDALLAGGAQAIIKWLAAAETATETWRLHGHHLYLLHTSEPGRLRLQSDETPDRFIPCQL